MVAPEASHASADPPGLTQAAIQPNEASRQANAKARRATAAVQEADEAARQAERTARQADEAARQAHAAASQANENARRAHEAALEANESARLANEDAFQANAAVSQANVFGGTFQPFRLLDLPPELRCRIYEYCVVFDKPLLAPSASRKPDSISAEQPAISKTSNLIRAETLPIFYKKNAFRFHLNNERDDVKHFCQYLHEIGARNRQLIKKISCDMLGTWKPLQAIDFVHSCLRLGACGDLELYCPVGNHHIMMFGEIFPEVLPEQGEGAGLNVATEDTYMHVFMEDFYNASSLISWLKSKPYDWEDMHGGITTCYHRYCSPELARLRSVEGTFRFLEGKGTFRFKKCTA
ncbi:unnamed protein product [Zymoseptoria tritici ST99CH_1E4]|uniref:F-box domain-containing protein n=1 Tax=Zymoseptoria tritici ST99CH_1E4 TaxID=1276532 RepID=A0A2H1GGL7_ZYMTR|nr:unnamed protein product [Zymoseptoria tritici ST99CH_1E4]